MKLAITKFASKKRIFTKALVVAGLVLVTLPSCKHSKGGCDAYQGSNRSSLRSVKKFKHHADVLFIKKFADIA